MLGSVVLFEPHESALACRADVVPKDSDWAWELRPFDAGPEGLWNIGLARLLADRREAPAESGIARCFSFDAIDERFAVSQDQLGKRNETNDRERCVGRCVCDEKQDEAPRLVWL